MNFSVEENTKPQLENSQLELETKSLTPQSVRPTALLGAASTRNHRSRSRLFPQAAAVQLPSINTPDSIIMRKGPKAAYNTSTIPDSEGFYDTIHVRSDICGRETLLPTPVTLENPLAMAFTRSRKRKASDVCLSHTQAESTSSASARGSRTTQKCKRVITTKEPRTPRCSAGSLFTADSGTRSASLHAETAPQASLSSRYCARGTGQGRARSSTKRVLYPVAHATRGSTTRSLLVPSSTLSQPPASVGSGASAVTRSVANDDCQCAEEVSALVQADTCVADPGALAGASASNLCSGTKVNAIVPCPDSVSAAAKKKQQEANKLQDLRGSRVFNLRDRNRHPTPTYANVGRNLNINIPAGPPRKVQGPVLGNVWSTDASRYSWPEAKMPVALNFAAAPTKPHAPVLVTLREDADEQGLKVPRVFHSVTNEEEWDLSFERAADQGQESAQGQTRSDIGDDMLSTIVVRSTDTLAYQTRQSPPPRLLSTASTNRIRTPSLSGSVSDASSICNLSPVSPSPGLSDGWNRPFHMLSKGCMYEASFVIPTTLGPIRGERELSWGIGEDFRMVFNDPLEPPTFSKGTENLATPSDSSKAWRGDTMSQVDLLLDAAERIRAATILLECAME